MSLETENAAFAARIDAACAALGLDCTPEQNRQLLAYLQGMQRWNKTYNITALRQPEQMLVQHIFDSLAPLPYLFEEVAPAGRPITVCDIGSGGGLPGVVMAIMAPAWRVQCIDAVEKKTAFVRQMSGSLNASNLQATHARVEQLAPQEADVVISRAFASLLDFATLSGSHLKPDGHLIAMKGKNPEAEIEDLQSRTPYRVEHIQPLVVPELNAQRCLVWMRRQKGMS